MIDKRELRIGNYFRTPDRNIEHEQPGYVATYAEVQALRFKGCSYKVDYADGGYVQSDELYEDIEPIPLTEEWLLKLGYKENMTNGYFPGNTAPYIHDEILAKSLAITHFDMGWHFVVRDTIQGIGCFNYVHQLQNFHFMITGQELTITQP